MKTKHVVLSILALFIPTICLANHGPGTSGGGTNTISGETFKEGQFVFSLRENYTNYRQISREDAEERALRSGEFDALSDAFLTSISVAYGVDENLQLELGTGWYSGRRFVDAHGEDVKLRSGGTTSENSGMVDHGERNSVTGRPEGLSDLALLAKYRVLQGRPGNLSVIGGVIFPAGDTKETLSSGQRFEPSSQPGMGRYGFEAGLAYSRYLTARTTIDISSVYTIRTTRDDFQVGERSDSGVAFSYRLTDSVQVFPQVSIFAEARNVWIDKDDTEEGRNPNSGGNVVYLSPGARLRLSESAAFSLAPSIPVIQDLNGDQIKTGFQLIGQLTVGL